MEKGTSLLHSGSGSPPGYELRDVNVRLFAAFMTGLSVLAIAGMLVVWAFTELMASREQKPEPPVSPLAGTLPKEPPEPRLQVRPAADLQKVRLSEQEILNSYAWIDEKGGIVRIPIGRAMDHLAERGLPARPQPSSAVPAARQGRESGRIQ